MERPADLDPRVPRIVRLDPDGPPKLSLTGKLWDVNAPLGSKEKAASDRRAGSGPISDARLDVEEDIGKVIEEAFTIARDRMMRRMDGGR